ncbi:hypothetical protein M0813_22475 [Anaeramoeba flamelloides]|uniref:Uncharacterized protein n=1 Tax=Anaeramoeba flamelloides TaxID=1746091 RepID=A0ABQ8YCP5_9EUKA|nr:hypothetical protein M0813_22475 [Anaeramoeba flamelloides]
MLPTDKLKQFKKDLKSLQETKRKYFISKWGQIVKEYKGDEQYETILIYFYKNFLLKYPRENWNYSILTDYCKRTNGYLEKNNRKLNEKIDHRKPGLNSLIYVLKNEEELQAKKYHVKMFHETTRNKNFEYDETDLEKRIQKEKTKWKIITDKLRKKDYFPHQKEKSITYKKY